ncbi:MAG: histidine phosphatase family protein [Planctomycetota bacterium]|nr:hypothetical protein [Planctomycetota bacterium]MDP6518831.1 histidine phosphatase family protein [Planctomycetota bacterium]MDP6839269.1 histidine phosphatase family protein [Planctomycetota bacterium]MDP6954528.1 histidine phosphatase family protein [Planctomycetota bacterium]
MSQVIPPPAPRQLDGATERQAAQGLPRVPHPGFGSGGRIWLVRHGRVDAAWSGRAYGNAEVPLSPDGEEDTRRLAEALATWKIAALACSPLERAHCLGRRLFGLLAPEVAGAQLRVSPDLRELDRGTWQGLPNAEYARRWAEEAVAYHAAPYDWRGNGGESDAQLTSRTWPVMEELMLEAAGGTAVLVAHDNVIRVLLAKALGIPPASSFNLRNDPGHASLLSDAVDLPGAGSRWVLERSNVRTPHSGPHPVEDVG